MEYDLEFDLDLSKQYLRDLVAQHYDIITKIRETKRLLAELQAEHKAIEEEMIEISDFIDETEKGDK
jgi:hypothetical protein